MCEIWPTLTASILERLRTNLKLLEVWLSLLLIPRRSRTERGGWAPLLCAPAPWLCVCVCPWARVHEWGESKWERERERERNNRRAELKPLAKGCFSLLATTIDLARRHFYWIKRKLSHSPPPFSTCLPLRTTTPASVSEDREWESEKRGVCMCVCCSKIDVLCV